MVPVSFHLSNVFAVHVPIPHDTPSCAVRGLAVDIARQSLLSIATWRHMPRWREDLATAMGQEPQESHRKDKSNQLFETGQIACLETAVCRWLEWGKPIVRKLPDAPRQVPYFVCVRLAGWGLLDEGYVTIGGRDGLANEAERIAGNIMASTLAHELASSAGDTQVLCDLLADPSWLGNIAAQLRVQCFEYVKHNATTARTWRIEGQDNNRRQPWRHVPKLFMRIRESFQHLQLKPCLVKFEPRHHDMIKHHEQGVAERYPLLPGASGARALGTFSEAPCSQVMTLAEGLTLSARVGKLAKTRYHQQNLASQVKLERPIVHTSVNKEGAVQARATAGDGQVYHDNTRRAKRGRYAAVVKVYREQVTGREKFCGHCGLDLRLTVGIANGPQRTKLCNRCGIHYRKGKLQLSRHVPTAMS
eukprot:NODE_407_length_1732_cov_70.997623_g301_i0.p1 GENE.NODE_407_length_1732_cov_70.997623_g301_i0~~NODE_407_length_1732_cov_70.997623_g301_i0.p1  ORF type:complete len:490 (+),score=38.32 NODE_407_length_1732_cov_70.997623_g301_i0:219-1472(+)